MGLDHTFVILDNIIGTDPMQMQTFSAAISNPLQNLYRNAIEDGKIDKTRENQNDWHRS